MGNKIGTLKLNREDSESFVKNLYFSEKEEIEKNEKRRKDRNENISITKIENGFIAEIKENLE